MKTIEEPYSSKSCFMPYLNIMADGPPKIYIVERVIDQIEWYDKKGSHNQTRYKRLSCASIILSALIPIFTLLTDGSFSLLIKVIITALSSSITAISAIVSLHHFQELWVQYRSNCEILKSTLHRYFTKTGEFKECEENKAFNLLVMSCEEYMIKEFQTWVASSMQNDSEYSHSSDRTNS